MNRRLRAVMSSRGAAFNPLSLSPAVWLKSDAGTLQTAGGSAASADADPVGQWQDQSGNGRHVSQATAGFRPLLKLAIQNGRSVIRFDGTDDFLKASTFTMNQPSHVMLVAKLTSGAMGATIFDGNTLNLMRAYDFDNASLQMYAGAFGPNLPITWGTFKVFSLLFHGASSFGRINAGSSTVLDAGASNAAGLTLGAHGDNAGFSSMDVGEVLVFPTALSVANETSVRNYLNGRWGVF